MNHNKEYGSEFWINESIFQKTRLREYCFSKNETLVSSGCAAISLAIASIPSEKRWKRALLPAYTCESVSYPFVANGFSVDFYDCDEQMNPDIHYIAAALKEPAVFVHMGHFGFATNRLLKDELAHFSSNGCYIIEDNTHTLFNTGGNLYSDCRVASIRKWLGVPSGGVYVSDDLDAFRMGANDPPQDAFANPRKEAMRIKGEYMQKYDLQKKEQFMRLFHEAEDVRKEDFGVYTIDATSHDILLSTNFEKLREQRRANFKILLASFTENKTYRPVFTRLPEGVCPLFFPIYVDKDNKAEQKKLAQKGLFAPIHWPANQFDTSNRPGKQFIDSHILAIPCDQRYSESDMQEIAKMINEIL